MKNFYIKILSGGLGYGLVYAELMSAYTAYKGEAFSINYFLVHFGIAFFTSVLIFGFILKNKRKKGIK